MGFRFQRRIRIVPGLHLNLSKFGVSASVGRRGSWLTFGPRGTRATVGIPGTGLSYTESSHAPRGVMGAQAYVPDPPKLVDAESVPATEEHAADSDTVEISALAVILGLAAIVALIAGAIWIFR
jgi:hypothetical protein